jgi:dihydrofolate synthase/folylpolyglutamate synthase
MRFRIINEWLAWLESLKIIRNAYVAKQQVKQIAQRLELLSPSAKIITVGGTNGKGSCVALLESLYNAANYKIGAFTSPHLLSFNERIRLQRKLVDDQKILAAFDVIDKARGDIELNYFQFVFLAALLIFKQAKLDLIILEVGIGGKYDATNIIDTDLAIISSIDLDHCEILGDTREKIGADKAGIMRPEKPVICGDFNPPQTIFTTAKNINAKLYCQGKDFHYKKADDHWNWSSDKKKLNELPLLNNILLQNAATVLMAIENFNHLLPVTDENIFQGLTDVIILGRQQLFSVNGIKILLDVAHNPAAAKCLITKLRSLNITGKKYAIVGLMQEKDIEGILAELVNDVDQWFVTQLPSPRSAKTEQFLQVLNNMGAKNIQHYAKSSDALQEALQRAEIGDIIVTFGSFLLVSDVLHNIIEVPLT